MSPKSLITLLIKIGGLFLLFSALKIVMEFLWTVSFTIISFFVNPLGFCISLVSVLICLLIYFILIRLCFYKTDFIIRKFSLAKHFNEDKFDSPIDQSLLVPMAIVVLGGVLIINAVLDLCSNFISMLPLQAMTGTGFYNQASDSVFYAGLKLMLGLVLIFNYKRLSLWLEKRQRG